MKFGWVTTATPSSRSRGPKPAGRTLACSSRSPAIAPARSRASTATTTSARVTQWMATPRPDACAAATASAVAAGSRSSSWSTSFQGPAAMRLLHPYGRVGSSGAPSSSSRWGSSPSLEADARRPSAPASRSGVASVTPVTPIVASRRPTSPRSSGTGGTRARNQRSRRYSSPAGASSCTPAACTAARLSIQSAPLRCCIRTGRSATSASSVSPSRGPATDSWYPIPRTHAPGAAARAA